MENKIILKMKASVGSKKAPADFGDKEEMKNVSENYPTSNILF